jgi:hypothetical protein
MLSNFVNVHLSKMSATTVLYSYQGVIDESITGKISELMDKHFEEKNIPTERRKNFSSSWLNVCRMFFIIS